MKKYLRQLTADKKVLILGFGREGKSTFRLLQENPCYAELGISDASPVSLDEQIDTVRLHIGSEYLDVLDEYDIVFKSPGVVLPKNARDYSCLITSQTELFLTCYSHQVIGVTGTKGKSTTSSLLFHLLNQKGKKSILIGNIGIPAFDVVDTIEPSTIIVFEISCHQLEYLEVSPSVAIFLNLYEDHLDHYGTFARYTAVKKNIFRHQKSLDILFCNPLNVPDVSECAARIIPITPESLPFNSIPNNVLRGKHNLLNVAFTYQVGKLFGITDTEFIAAISSFRPLSHRLELIGTKNDVEYYDDSVSTTVESTISAIDSIENAGVLLVGGLDRKLNYSKLIEYLLTSSLDEVVFMYESGARIYQEIKALPPTENTPVFTYKSNLQEATKYAQGATKRGKACILSPASASYGYFKNFEDRGDTFRELIFNHS